MKPNMVFTPGSLPVYTYNDRSSLKLEWSLLDSIETKGFISSVSGPSKSGKTVLCETVIGKKKMLLLTGGGISSEGLFWAKLRSKLGLPTESSKSRSADIEMGLVGKVEAAAQLPLIGKAGGSFEGNYSQTNGITESKRYDGPDGTELLDYVARQGYTLVVDDFHYIARDVQSSLAEQFKEAARSGVTIVVVSVSHRSDESIRANPDLRGRVKCVDIPYWQPQELEIIANKGFPLLNMHLDNTLTQRLAKESISSPQLMQALCLQFCRDAEVDETLPSLADFGSDQSLNTTLTRTASLANCKTAFDIIVTGPKPRGSERKTYNLITGKAGDVYYVILKAIARGEPLLTLPYAAIKNRVEEVVPSDPPRGVGIIQALQQMHNSVTEKLGEDRVLEWDEEKETLNILDPYFLYYLRWTKW